MPNYRVEALMYHAEKNHEDTLEQQVLSRLYDIGGTSAEVVVLEVFPNGSPRFDQVHTP